MNPFKRGLLQSVLRLGTFLLCAHSVSSIAAQALPAKQVPEYTVIDLGPFMAREIDERPGLNRQDHVASWQVISQTYVTASLIEETDVTPVVGTPKESNSFAFGINDKDEMVGLLESRNDIRQTQAFWYRNHSLQLLPTLGGPSAAARSISERDVIVGNAQTATRQMHAVVWENGKIEDLGTLPGGNFSRAFEINDSGEIAGEANTTPNGKVHAVLWSRDRIHDLGLLPGGSFSSAQAVNGRHQAVGFADDKDGGSKAVLFSDGKIIDLGSFGDEPSSALGMNDAGQIVGSSPIAEGKMRAFLWEKGHLFNLNDLIPDKSGWLLMTAYRINAAGQILAYGFYQGRTHGCLLTPSTTRRTSILK